MLLSIGMMVKNEEKHLDDCLNALMPILKGLDSELIIVDTGSTDKTVEIAKKYTDKVYFHNWTNNFSEIRNISLSYCTGNWFFCIDGDEVLENCNEIINFFISKAYRKYKSAAIYIKNFTELNNENEFSIFPSLRLFCNDKDFKFVNAVHNQPLYKEPIKYLNVNCKHYGYINNDKELMNKKFKRTSTILKDELKKDPENVYYIHQLAVTYMMYNDNVNSLKESKRAFDCFLKHKLNPKEYIYLYYQLGISYVNNKKYEEAEKILEEGIKIENDYVDLYFYLGSVKMALGKYNEGFSIYGKYFNLIKNYDNLPIKNNIEIINYTLGFTDIAYYNMAVIYYNIKDYTSALNVLNKITSEKYIQISTNLFIDVCFKLNNYEMLKNFYKKNIIENKNVKNAFLVSIEKKKNKLNYEYKKAFIKIFSNGDDEYFRLNSIRLSYLNNDDRLYDIIIKFINSINMNNCSDYYGDLIYYLLKIKKPINNLMSSISEYNINKYLNYIFNVYDDFAEAAVEYISTTADNSFKDMRINKIICKWILVSGKIDDYNYSRIFYRYINDGIGYILALYKNDILDNEFVYDLKNNDEVFFLYIYLAKKIKESDRVKYIFYLKKALNLCPFMSKGIKILLNEFENSNNKINREFENYKIILKQKIKQLIENNNIDEALNIINEYEKIVKDDIEIYSVKGCAFIEKGKFIEAEKILKQGLNVNNRNFDLNYDMAYLYENISEYELSLEYYKRAIETAKDESMINEINSKINIILNKLNLPAEENLLKNDNKIISFIKTNQYNKLINYLMDLIKRRKFKLVLTVCNYLIITSKVSIPAVYLLKGIACNGLKNYELAEEYHKIAIKLDKNLCDIVGDGKKSDIKYEENITTCIGCGNRDYSIVNISNQSLSESNKGFINPIRKWVKCKKCGLIYSNPIPSEETMNNYYSVIAKEKFGGIYGNIKDRESFLFSMANDRINKINAYVKNGKILDIGTGIGVFVKAARDRGIEAYGLELTPEDCQYAKINYGLDLMQKNFYDFNNNDVYDVVTMFEVIEHLRHPQKDLIRINKLIKKNGMLVVATPILDSKYAEESKENNAFWYVVSHLSYFTKDVLINYLKKAGFKIIDIKDSFEGMGRMDFYCRKINEI
jgi:glycosyltransferase involved in cell wall biosynthesis/2-polyprenyl-3-methyl-5-hydroxy-6-metoxy-1,4-benzoquinol methylase/predicted negative regulator of RcsB-dependent stress response